MDNTENLDRLDAAMDRLEAEFDALELALKDRAEGRQGQA